jgi:mono/diheme cytochrome c family protein
MKHTTIWLASAVTSGAGLAFFLSMAAPSGAADTPMAHRHGDGGRQAAPIHTTMKALHAHGGTPPGWTFALPAGDAAAGRKVFVSMECYACHDVKGEQFPRDSKTPHGQGPDMTGMGSHHPAEYFAESIVNPNRVIVDGDGYVGGDGLSKMPSYADTMTVKQLEANHHHHGMGGSMESGGSMKMK